MKMMKKKPVLLYAAIFFILIGNNFTENKNLEIQSCHNNSSNNLNNPNAAVNHAPIFIDGNAELATFISNEGLSGNGTYASPYIIENFNIDASTANGIHIEDTNSYLIIKNCMVDGKDSKQFYGIYLYHSSNVNISNNNLINNLSGIIMRRSSNNSLFGNNVNYNFDGIVLSYECDNNILSGNNITYNSYGINLLGSKKDNTIYYNYIFGNQYEQVTRILRDLDYWSDNRWDNGTTGNYWGNYYIVKNPDATNDGTVWNTPYEIEWYYIEEDVNWLIVRDNFPLVISNLPDFEAPLIFNNSQKIIHIEGYKDLKIAWTAGDLHPATYTIELNGSESVPVTTLTNGVEIIYNIPNGLLKGDYNITIIIIDESGNVAQHTVKFTVQPIIPKLIIGAILIGIPVGVYIYKKRIH